MVRAKRAISPASYLSQSSVVVHFGLGAAGVVDRLEIRWPRGTTSVHGPLAAGRRWEIIEGERDPRELGLIDANGNSIRGSVSSDQVKSTNPGIQPAESEEMR